MGYLWVFIGPIFQVERVAFEIIRRNHQGDFHQSYIQYLLYIIKNMIYCR